MEYNTPSGNWFKKFGRIGIIAIVVIIVWFVQPFTFENIDAGNVGIKINLYGSDRGVDNITIVTGRVWYNTWTTKIVEFPTFTQSVDYDPFVVTTRDAAEFKVDPKLNYHVNPAMVPQIYRQYRKPLNEIEQQFMRNTIYDAYRIVANSFTSDSVMSNRERFEDKIQLLLSKNLNKDGFVYDQLTSAITPPESLRKMIDEKNASIQARLKAENEAKQAEAEAKVKVATANGEAQALLIKAKAESEANRLRQQSLTPLLIQQQWIQKWNGTLPTTQAGGANLMMGIK
ncbi:SPFH domain-containing protein [Pedobacter rhizosphaerae]|uniref:Regulator of protease activity HflC, stomatin/prohibitin superfamily n=1 Tax=Pedobacter rhizosphaerae TaxID=390241 RepID=A0A1H9UF74_9SPHI|nr:SPFH domain-containing protein [Pedobacter rhizosphaerae]SES07703.1 Regulator of protease activity HflC, stomatin/prohibitin superfamily [Pedobacter rhizosphaerae]